MNINDFVRSKIFRWILILLGELIILLLVFWLGTMVGSRQANFMLRWGENYERNFGSPGRRVLIMRPPGFPPGVGFPPGPEFLNPHGVSAVVLKIDGNTIIVKGENDTERTVAVSDSTTIRKQMQTIKISDIKAGDSIVVIGSPNNQGQIEAKFIRVF